MDECRNDPTEQAPFTLGQERLWFLDRLDPGDPAYNIHLAHRSEEIEALPLTPLENVVLEAVE